MRLLTQIQKMAKSILRVWNVEFGSKYNETLFHGVKVLGVNINDAMKNAIQKSSKLISDCDKEDEIIIIKIECIAKLD